MIMWLSYLESKQGGKLCFCHPTSVCRPTQLFYSDALSQAFLDWSLFQWRIQNWSPLLRCVSSVSLWSCSIYRSCCTILKAALLSRMGGVRMGGSLCTGLQLLNILIYNKTPRKEAKVSSRCAFVLQIWQQLFWHLKSWITSLIIQQNEV